MSLARHAESGVTLLELLVAVTLVGLLSVGMLFALHVSLDGSQKAQTRMEENRRVIGVERIFRQELSNLIPVTVRCRPQGSQGPPAVLFEGRSDEMRFVSTYSLSEAARGRPRLLEFKVIPGDEGNGVRLIVNERSYGGPAALQPLCLGIAPVPGTSQQIAQFTPVQVGSYSFVLADKLAYCRLSYREERQPPELERWTPMWANPVVWPTAVHVDMAPLVDQPSRLQLTNVTIPLRINRDAFGDYQE